MVVGADTDTMCGVEVVLDLVSELSVVLGLGILSSSPVKLFRLGLFFWLLCLESDSGLDGRLSPSERYEVVGVVEELEHDPGPKMLRRTGRRKRPWRKPREMTRRTILKKVTKMYEGAIMRPITPRMVDTAPWRMGRPRP